MPAPATSAGAAERLRASPNFALTFTMDGRPYIAQDSEPYVQYWLTERYRILLGLFSGRGGASVEAAVAGYFRLTETAPTPSGRKALTAAIRDMRGAGVLIGARDDTSRYDSRIAADYVTYRPFPRPVAQAIVAAAPIGRDSAVLDLAGGPGSLALLLAEASDNVSMMELSRGFVAAARRRARQLGRNLTTLHDSCNRLVFQDGAYDAITVSQALHWLDDVMVCRGVCRLLKPDGSFLVIHGAFDVAADHPLAHLLGRRSVLGDKAEQSFADEVRPLLRRLSLLFEALDAPDVDRVDLARTGRGEGRIVPVRTTLYRQHRPMGLGFARAFLTPRHIAVTGQAPAAFWRDVTARCAAAPDRIGGTYHWAVLHFRRGGTRDEAVPEAEAAIGIGYDGPSEA